MCLRWKKVWMNNATDSLFIKALAHSLQKAFTLIQGHLASTHRTHLFLPASASILLPQGSLDKS